MKSIAKFVPALLFVAFLAALWPSQVSAQGPHPYYLHALSDLRAAREHLNRPDGGALHHEEQEAIHQINDAISDIKKAAMEDGKDLNEHPPVDVNLDWSGRLHRALELLQKAHRDLERDESNPEARGLQQRSFDHIDKAIHEVRDAIRIVESRS